jgi:hypothetical protein
LIREIPGFRDEAIYKGGQVHFYKWAQILAADLYGAFNSKWPTYLKNLTMFADYRVPQILRERGVLEYSEALSTWVDTLQEIAHSEEAEVEIRAATVVACNEISKLSMTKMPVEIDWMLWQLGEKNLATLKPHHWTLSIFY